MRRHYPVSLSCEVLQVSPSGYFNWLRRQGGGGGRGGARYSDEALLAYIRPFHAEVRGEYGWLRMHKELVARDIRVGKERVRRLMQQHGIRAKTPRRFVVTTDSRHSLPVASDLVQRRFIPEAPNRLWSGDITYVATDEGGRSWRRSLTLWLPGGGLEPAGAHAYGPGQECLGYGVMAPPSAAWPDLSQRPGQPILQL